MVDYMAKKSHIYCLYMVTNTVNGKRYIGITRRRFEIRKNQHINLARQGSKGCPRLYDAIRKYGESAFEWKVMARGLSEKNAYIAEMALIKKIRLSSEEYNVSKGGSSGGPLEAANKRPVICLEDGKLYPSIKSAALAYGAGGCDVSEVCTGKRRKAKGKHFVFGAIEIPHHRRQEMIVEMEMEMARKRRRVVSHKNVNSLIVAGRDRMGRSAAGPMAHSRKVICLDDMNIFPSATSAALNYSVAKSALIELCLRKNRRRTVSGKRFCYIENYISDEMAVAL